MNDRDRLSEKIGKFADSAETVTPEGRTISADEPLAAIIDEIDETILPREITFHNNKGAALVLEVSGRRLTRIVSGPELPQTATGPLGEHADAQIAALQVSLQAFLDGASEFKVRTRALPERAEASVVGKSSDALRGLLSGDAPSTASPPDDVTDVPSFIAAMKPTGAVSKSPGGEERTWGTAPRIGDDALAGALDLLGKDREGAIVVTHGETGQSLLVGRLNDTVLIVDAAEHDLLTGLGRWAALAG